MLGHRDQIRVALKPFGWAVFVHFLAIVLCFVFYKRLRGLLVVGQFVAFVWEVYAFNELRSAMRTFDYVINTLLIKGGEIIPNQVTRVEILDRLRDLDKDVSEGGIELFARSTDRF